MASSLKKAISRQAENTLRGKSRISFNQIRQRHFWSSYYFQPDGNGVISAGRYTLFTTPVGSNGQGFPSGQVITDRESNWKSQNRVPDNQNIQLTELGCQVMSAQFAFVPQTVGDALIEAERNKPPSALGLSHLFQSGVLSITYLTNTVQLGLLADFSQAGGPFGGVSNSNGTIPSVGSIVQNGMGAPALRRKFKIPIVLGAGESFNFNIEIPRALYVDGVSAFLIRMDGWATESFGEKS